MPLGGLVTLLVLLPNLLVFFFPPTGLPAAGGKKSSLTLVMEIASLAGMILALSFYYINWGRYALQGRTFRLLFQPCLGIPLPLAISPVVYFLLASVLFHSWYLLLAAVVLGIGHIYVSSLEWRGL